MKKLLIILIILLFCFSLSDAKQHRSQYQKKKFLKSMGLTRVPKGYEVDHKIPLWKGGADKPANMQLLPIKQHKAKTKFEMQQYWQEHGNPYPTKKYKPTKYKPKKH